jgi:glyoxylase-like metal-dependent hydrolase (beta-lactamase superfamily II)
VRNSPASRGPPDLAGHKPVLQRALPRSQADQTYLHIPELRALVVGDIVYNDAHVNIASTDHAKRLAWIDSLRAIGDLRPQTVGAGHRRPDPKDTAQTIPDTISYLQDFDDVLAQRLGVAGTIAWMLERRPTRLNITTQA